MISEKHQGLSGQNDRIGGQDHQTKYLKQKPTKKEGKNQKIVLPLKKQNVLEKVRKIKFRIHEFSKLF